jgi:hypothetical protein
MVTEQLAVDSNLLREEVKSKYRDVAVNPSGEYHFHTGRPLARRLGYDSSLVDSMPDSAVESFAGVANPIKGSECSTPDPAGALTALSLLIRLARRAK